MRVLCTGGMSPVGAPLVRRLAADGDEVRVLTRFGRSARLDGVKCQLYYGDIRDRHAVARAAYGCDSVIHLAYAPVSASDRGIIDTAVRGMSSVMRACELYGIRDFLLVSSPRADDPEDCYGLGKRVSEQMAEAWLQSGTFRRVVCARVYNAYGPDMGTDHVIPQFIGRMLSLMRTQRKEPVIRFPVKGSGGDIRSFIWREDCTEQLVALFRQGGSGFVPWDVGDLATECTIADLAYQVAGCLGREIDVDPSAPAADPAARLPHPERMLTVKSCKDFSEGLQETVAWYREHEEVFIRDRD